LLQLLDQCGISGLLTRNHTLIVTLAVSFLDLAGLIAQLEEVFDASLLIELLGSLTYVILEKLAPFVRLWESLELIILLTINLSINLCVISNIRDIRLLSDASTNLSLGLC
jgi:hypothetical protein